MNKRYFTLIAATTSMLILSTSAHAQLPSPSHGWNMGNTLESTWGNPAPTQALINSVAAAGFNTVRVPCAWSYQSDKTGTIKPAYMSQVKQVVDWCISKKLYVIINDHWDTGWLENSSFVYDKPINDKLQNMWTQIATTFKSYDNHLLFACANEPNAKTEEQSKVLFQYYQNWVKTVRDTGGKNSKRWLIVQAPNASIDNAAKWVTDMPSDPAKHVMLEAHNYDPFQFTLMNDGDANWGKMFYFWGAAYHTKGLADRNATWGEENYIDTEMDKAKAFVKRGIPVLLGEWRAEPKSPKAELSGQLLTQNYNSCTYWNYYFHKAANSRGLYVTCWDTPGQLFDWTTGAVKDQTQIDSLIGKSYVPPISGL